MSEWASGGACSGGRARRPAGGNSVCQAQCIRELAHRGSAAGSPHRQS